MSSLSQINSNRHYYSTCNLKDIFTTKFFCKTQNLFLRLFMPYKRKTWKEKMKIGASPILKINRKKYADIPEGASMLIPTPEIVNDYIRHVPKNQSTTLQQMRKDLAAAFHAQYCCPITSGIFLRIIAEAAFEEWQQNKKIEEITPFWRIINMNSPLAQKLSFGTDFLKAQRGKEGLTV